MSKSKLIVFIFFAFLSIFFMGAATDSTISPSSHSQLKDPNNPNNTVYGGINFSEPISVDGNNNDKGKENKKDSKSDNNKDSTTSDTSSDINKTSSPDSSSNSGSSDNSKDKSTSNTNIIPSNQQDKIRKLEEQRMKEETAVTKKIQESIHYIEQYMAIEEDKNTSTKKVKVAFECYENENGDYFKTHISGKIDNKVYIEVDQVGLKKKIDDLSAEIAEEQKSLTTTTQKIANIYAEAEKNGDPVDVSTGRFIADYTDYVAQDFLDIFTVKRNLTYGNFKESFGNNWGCSLDSRIIRCNFGNSDANIKIYENILDEINKIKELYENFTKKYNYANDELKKNYEKSLIYEKKCKEIISNIYKRDILRASLDEKNKYVTYGKFSDRNNYSGFENLLLYITNDGVKLGFCYTENGVWLPVSGLTLGIVRIKGLNPNGGYSGNENCDGGYELIFEDSSKKRFSPFGILEEETDRNNNKTIYKSKNGRIYEVLLKTGEVIKIERNDRNYITSIEGNISGSAHYIYENDNLVKVINSDNIAISYVYNDKGDLVSIIKNNNSRIKMDYEYDSILKHNVCVAVTNGNNNREEFYLNAKDRIMEHNYYGYGNEISYFDDSGKTTYYADLHGSVMELEYDSFSEIIAITKDGNRKEYEYDEMWRPISITYEDGGKDLTFYNELGLITKVTDRDGFSNSFEYDEYGNMIKSYMGNKLCGTYWYYPNGLLKGYTENNNNIEFKYNQFGSVIEKIKHTSDGKIFITKWVYDEKNKLKECIEPSGEITYCEYGDKKEILTKGNNRVTNIFNERNLIIERIDEDLSTGEKYVRKNIYDNLDNIIQVFINGKLLTEYEYYKNGILKSYTAWNNPSEKYKKDLLYGIKTEYKYNDKWLKIGEVRTKIVNCDEVEKLNIVEYTYNKQSKNTVVTENKYLDEEKKSTYNVLGKLIKEEWAGGYAKFYSYSKAGRLLTVRDSLDNLYIYKYSPDGSYKITFENYYGGSIVYDYNSYGELVRIKDFYGLSYLFEYDSSGNLIYKKTPSYSITNKYDNKNRNIQSIFKNNMGDIISEYSIKFDDKTNTEYFIYDGCIESEKKFNAWGMLIESRGQNGHYFYSHDYLGNCSKITDYYGNEIKFEYSPLCELLVEEYWDGTTKSYEYSLSGIKRKIRRNERELYSSTFDNGYLETKTLGGINRIKMNKDCSEVDTSFYDTGNYHTERTNQNYYSVTDESGNSYIYETDKYGQVIKEKNPLGYISKFNYAKDGMISKKENYSGTVEKYDYNVEKRTTTIEYSTGEKIEFVNDERDNLVKLNTNNYSLEFEYDKRGNLISEYSVKTNTKINYFYDDYSRCIRKSGANFSFAYFYDEMSRLMKVKDEMSDNWIEFEYDNFLRVKNKKYSNGMESSYGYNEYGQLEYSITKNNLGLILAGEFLLYDKLGRVSIKSDASGNVTKYKYDERSRLISTEYPYTKERNDAYLDEATECGYYILEKNPKVGNISFTNDELFNIRKLYEKAGVNSYITININQKTWLEKYDYSKNGSITSVINPYGEIEYKYDNLNRLISKNYKSSNNNGIKLKWNKDNLLEEIISAKRKMSFSYGEIKRPKSIKIEDYMEDSCDIVEYLYDGLGRRVLEKTYDKNIEYIYDGFSTVLLSRQNITNNDFLSSVYKDDLYKTYENTNKLNNNYNTKSLYRNVDNDKYKPFGQFQENRRDKKENKIINYNTEESVISENCNILSFGKAPCLISYNDNSKSYKNLADFVLTDYKHQIIGTVNTISDYVEYNEFDTWGNCILKEKNKVCSNDFIIDFGYRDYIPLLKTFTSEDPVRDGKNWFAYCSCDSVNYFDNLGFAKQSLSDSDNLLYQSYIYSFLNFNELDFHNPAKRDKFNRYMGLYGAFDCTDNAISVCHLAMKTAKLMENDEYMKKLSQTYTVDDYRDAKAVACSRDIYEGRMGRKVCDGVDNEFIKRVNEGKSEFDTNSTEYKEEMAKRDRVNKCLQNPDIIKPGSVLVWKDSEHNRTYKDGFPSSCGHAVTVLSREFDENGNIIGIVVIEGHTGGERTELTYLDVRDIAKNTSVHDYRGEFAGVYEMESADAEKYEPVCVM